MAVLIKFEVGQNGTAGKIFFVFDDEFIFSLVAQRCDAMLRNSNDEEMRSIQHTNGNG